MGAKECANYLGVCISTLYGWYQRNDGPPCYVWAGKTRALRRYRIADVEAWLKTRQVGGH